MYNFAIFECRLHYVIKLLANYWWLLCIRTSVNKMACCAVSLRHRNLFLILGEDNKYDRQYDANTIIADRTAVKRFTLIIPV